PSAASFGGGGLCLYRSPEGGVESLDFLVRRAADGGSVGVPGTVRGLALLQARHGRLSFDGLVSLAERLALDGVPVSKTLARDLARVSEGMAEGSSLARRFRAVDGGPLREGDRLVQPELAAFLSLLRSRGAGDAYAGSSAGLIAEGADRHGGALRPADLWSYQTGKAPALALGRGDRVLVMPGERTGSGILHVAAAERAIAMAEGAWPDAALIARSTGDELLARGASALPEHPGSSAFLVVGRDGEAVACGLTMGAVFGRLEVVPEFGVVLASSPEGASGLASAFLAPVFVADPEGREIFLVAAAAGGPEAVSASLAAGFGTARPERVTALSDAEPRGAAHLLVCPEGLLRAPESCRYAADPAREGVALIARGPR
ncbi:MAG: gamma-glutamyltransferase, partial [Alphaproteobacteria bacterium]|nr:gamma-glutamyltransferase [Alphaproteobacteria bacterium]